MLLCMSISNLGLDRQMLMLAHSMLSFLVSTRKRLQWTCTKGCFLLFTSIYLQFYVFSSINLSSCLCILYMEPLICMQENNCTKINMFTATTQNPVCLQSLTRNTPSKQTMKYIAIAVRLEA